MTSSDEFAVTIVEDVITVEFADRVATAIPIAAAVVFTQDTPSALWTIDHGLNGYPAVTVVDTLVRVVHADVVYVDLNTITVAFTNPATGQAFLT